MKLKNKALLKKNSYIHGKWLHSKKEFPVTNPYNSDIIAQVTNHGKEETNQAIAAAAEAFKIWSKFSASKRSKILKNWRKLQLENLEDLATILTTEQGKPLAEARGEIKYGASFVEWFAAEALRVYGDVIPGHMANKRITVIKQAVGVVGAITPWNFPSAMISRKVAPALAAGCTVVIKPSELTPLSALALAQLAEEAGMPSGVFNVVCGTDAAAIGQEMCSNPELRKISFTGSTRVGKILLSQSADTIKKVSLELGGNAPFIVFDDADVDKAVEACISSKFRNAGQTCICTNRILVHKSIHDSFVEKLAIKIKALKVGSGLDVETEVGPMINTAAIKSVSALLENAIQEGANISEGGHLIKDQLFEPTLVVNATKDMDLFKKEIFGPIAAVYKFETEQEAIELANDTKYGLAAYFFGSDYRRIWRVSEALEYGMVGINTAMISTTLAPFGGVKESGFGREGSKYGMDEYLNIKYMAWDV